MSMNSTQRWMGGVVLLCGGTLLAALVMKGKQELHQNGFELPTIPNVMQSETTVKTADDQANEQAMHSFGVDVATEQRLLEQQRLAREKSVAEQEAKAAEFLRLQQQAEAAAAQKAAEETAAIHARRLSEQQSSDNIPPQFNSTAAAPKAVQPANSKAPNSTVTQTPQQAAVQAQRQAEIQRLAAQQKAVLAEKRKTEAERQALEQKAQAEKKRLADEIKALEAKRQATLEKLQAEEQQRKALEASQLAAKQKAEAEAKKRAEIEAKKRADAEEARRILEGDSYKPVATTATTTPTATKAAAANTNSTKAPATKPTRGWVVQVALAASQANADAMVAKLRAKGYNVTTSRTSKGVRVLVGPNGANDRANADATRQKITTDPTLGMNSAWVMDWQPPKAQ